MLPPQSKGLSQGQGQAPALKPTPESTVHPLVVKDIWRRSKLPDFVLEEIWDLVAIDSAAADSHDVDDNVSVTGDVMGLGREQFVVGIWLIDQKLKGRKLPSKVGQSVWNSVRGMSGVKIPHQKGW